MIVRCVWVAIALAACGSVDRGGASSNAVDNPLVASALAKCRTCHGTDGPGIELRRDSTEALSGLIHDRVSSGSMPPWQPGPGSVPFVGNYGLTPEERESVLAWAASGGHLQNELQDPQSATIPAGAKRVGDLVMPHAYVPPPPPVGDEYRCFVLPWEGPPVAVVAYRWKLGIEQDPTHRTSVAHHVTGRVVSAIGATEASARQGRDGRPGFPCVAWPPDLEDQADLGASGVGPAMVQAMPPGTGVILPTGGAVVMQVHYRGAAAAGDVSGVELWEQSREFSAIQQWALWAPVELPCPTGVSSDPRNRCSREWAIANSTLQTPDELRAQEQYVLGSCGQTVAGKLGTVAFAKTIPEHWLVPSACEGTFPTNGVLRAVHGHMHTMGASIRVELRQADGAWSTILDIPNWRWIWERAYTMQTPIPIQAGQRVRVSCQHDNGSQAQWGLLSKAPGMDGRAERPLQDVAYVVMGLEARNEMCEVFFAWTRT